MIYLSYLIFAHITSQALIETIGIIKKIKNIYKKKIL